MGKNKNENFEDENKGFKRIKEQRKPIKNFKTHLKQMVDNEEWDGDEDSIYTGEWR
jgi:hypothetical protein